MTESEAQLCDTLHKEVQELTSELSSLKIQMKSKENSWNKECAILEQRIELQDLQIKDYKQREENLKKMNETFMETLSGLSNDSTKFTNKSIKDMKGLLEGMNSDSEINKIKRQDLIQKLEIENRSLKDQQQERSLQVERMVAEHDKRTSEQESLIASLTDQAKSLLSTAKKTEEEERAIKAQLIADYHRQINELTKDIEKIRTDCAIEISTSQAINEQRLQQIKQLYEKQEREKPAKKELSEEEINYIDEIQQLHHNEITKLHDQIDSISQISQNKELNAKKTTEELEQRLQDVTEILKSFKQKNITNEQNIKLMKDKFQRQEMDLDELDTLKEQVKKLKAKNITLLAEIRQQDSVEVKLKEQLLEQTCLIEDERSSFPRKESVYKATLEQTGMLSTQILQQQQSISGSSLHTREDYSAKIKLTELENPSMTNASERCYFTQPVDGSVGVTPRQHFKSVSESEYPQGDYYEREEQLKRAGNQQQQSNRSNLNSGSIPNQKIKQLPGMIIHKGLTNRHLNSPEENRIPIKDHESLQNHDSGQQVLPTQASSQFHKTNIQNGTAQVVNASVQLSSSKAALVPPLSGGTIRSASISQMQNSCSQTSTSGSVSNRGGQPAGTGVNFISLSNMNEGDQSRMVSAVGGSHMYCDNCHSNQKLISPAYFNYNQPQKNQQQSSSYQIGASQVFHQQNLTQFLDQNDSLGYEQQILEIVELKQITEDLSRQLEQSAFENNNLHAANETLSSQLRSITSENENLFHKTQSLLLEIEHLNGLISQAELDRRKKEENELHLKQEIKYLVDKLLKEKEKQDQSSLINRHVYNHPTTPRTEGSVNNITRSFSRITAALNNPNNQSSPSLKFDRNRPGRDSINPCSDAQEEFAQIQQQAGISKPPIFTSSVNISQMFNNQNCVNQSLCLNGSTKSPGFLNFIHQNKENSSFQTRKAAGFGSVERAGSVMSGRTERIEQKTPKEAESQMMGIQNDKQKRMIRTSDSNYNTTSINNQMPIDQHNQNVNSNLSLSYEGNSASQMDHHYSSISNLKTAPEKPIPRQKTQKLQPSNNLKSMIQKEEERSFYQRSKTQFSSRFNSSVDRKQEQSLQAILDSENMAKKQLFSQDQQLKLQSNSSLSMRLDIPKSKQEFLYE